MLNMRSSSSSPSRLPAVVLFSSSQGVWGGSQAFNEGLCNFLGARGIGSAIATASPDLYSCNTVKIPSNRRPVWRLAVSVALAISMKRDGSKVVVLDDLSGIWLAPVFRLFGFTVLSILHLELKRKDKMGFGYNWIPFQMLRFGSRFAHTTFSVGTANISAFPVEVSFLGNFVPPYFFEAPNKVQKTYDMGAICRLSPEKDLTLLLKIVANLKKHSGRPVGCLIAGDGPEKKVLVATAAQLGLRGDVHFVPWTPRKEAVPLFDQIRCFGITSHHEGFPTTLLESHARGIPALVADTSGFCPEFVSGYGEPTGLVFSRSDIEKKPFLDSLMSLIDSSEDFRSDCVSKATKFSESYVLGRIAEKLEGYLGKV